MTLFSTSHDLKSADAPGAANTGEPSQVVDPLEGEMAPPSGVLTGRAPTVRNLRFHSFTELGEWWHTHARTVDA